MSKIQKKIVRRKNKINIVCIGIHLKFRHSLDYPLTLVYLELSRFENVKGQVYST